LVSYFCEGSFEITPLDYALLSLTYFTGEKPFLFSNICEVPLFELDYFEILEILEILEFLEILEIPDSGLFAGSFGANLSSCHWVNNNLDFGL
jgi:hypothetical protein